MTRHYFGRLMTIFRLYLHSFALWCQGIIFDSPTPRKVHQSAFLCMKFDNIELPADIGTLGNSTTILDISEHNCSLFTKKELILSFDIFENKQFDLNL